MARFGSLELGLRWLQAVHPEIHELFGALLAEVQSLRNRVAVLELLREVDAQIAAAERAACAGTEPADS